MGNQIKNANRNRNQKQRSALQTASLYRAQVKFHKQYAEIRNDVKKTGKKRKNHE